MSVVIRSLSTMDRARETGIVAGEPAEQLLEILLTFSFTDTCDGMMKVGGAVSREDGACLMRAIMRVEAELLLQDAARLTDACAEPRTATQRRADAFVALALRVADVMSGR